MVSRDCQKYSLKEHVSFLNNGFGKGFAGKIIRQNGTAGEDLRPIRQQTDAGREHTAQKQCEQKYPYEGFPTFQDHDFFLRAFRSPITAGASGKCKEETCRSLGSYNKMIQMIFHTI